MNFFCSELAEEGCYFDHSAIGSCSGIYLKKDGCKMIIPYDFTYYCDDDTPSEVNNNHKEVLMWSKG
jgi:hypothetical protein